MSREDTASPIVRYRMPRLADRIAFDWVGERISLLDHDTRVILDFEGTLHLDFRALKRFVRRRETLEGPREPITLAECSPYVGEIIRFTLSGRDWDLFIEESRDEPTSNRGVGNRSDRFGLPADRAWGIVRGAGWPHLFTPSPN